MKILMTPIGELGKDTQARAPRDSARRRRNYTRFKVPLPIHARAGRRELRGTTATLGMGGMFVLCREPFPPETEITFRLASAGGKEVVAKGKVAYLATGGMGIRFSGMTPGASRQLKDMVAEAVRPFAR